MSEQDHGADELYRNGGTTVSDEHVEEIRDAAREAARVMMTSDVSPLELGLPDLWVEDDSVT